MYNIHQPSTERRTVKVLARILRPLGDFGSERIRAIPSGSIVEADVSIYPGLTIKHVNWLSIPEQEVQRIAGKGGNYGFPAEINNKLYFEKHGEPGVPADTWEMITDISPENPFGYWNKIKASRNPEAYA